MTTTGLTVIGEGVLEQDAARAGLRRRLRRRLAPQPGQLILHPLWICRAEVVADRPPFAPVVRGAQVFVDGVSEYRGLLASLQPVRPVQVDAERDGDGPASGTAWWGERRVVVHPAAVDRERALELVRDVQLRQINRSYALRKPRHRVVDLDVHHLPLWRFATTEGPPATVNAVTGADEAYLASRW